MLEELRSFWRVLEPKITKTVRQGTENCVRREIMDVSTAPDGHKIGVRQPYGEEINLPYAPAAAGAKVGQSVIVEWRGSLSTGVAVSMGDGIAKPGILYADIKSTWVESGGVYTQNVSVPGMRAEYTPIPIMDSAAPSAEELNAFKMISHVVAAENSITLFATGEITTEINILLKI